MIQPVRQAYNEAYSPERYRAFLDNIEHDFPGQLAFRVAETPVFVPRVLTDKILTACSDILAVITRDDFKTRTERAIPAGQRVPNESPDDHTQFLAIDFAVCRDDSDGELLKIAPKR